VVLTTRPRGFGECYEMTDVPKNEEEQVYANLIAWLKSHGVNLSNVSIYEFPNGLRGMRVEKSLLAGETLISIPIDLQLSQKLAQESYIGQFIKALASQYEVISEHYFSAFLLQERFWTEESFWKPYLDSLPKDFSFMPDCFTEEEFAYLRGSHIFSQVQMRMEKYKNDYEYFSQHIPSFPTFSFEQFLWARQTVRSRTFSAGNARLIPFIDMVNHQGYVSEDEDKETREKFNDFGLNGHMNFVLTTEKDYHEGEELCITYNTLSNTKCFYEYGFNEFNIALQEVKVKHRAQIGRSLQTSCNYSRLGLNEISTDLVFIAANRHPFDSCQLTFNFGEDTAMYHEKVNLLGSTSADFIIRRDMDHRKVTEMLTYLRFIHSTTVEYLHLTKGGYDISMVVDKKSYNLRNELVILEQLAKACRSRLQV